MEGLDKLLATLSGLGGDVKESCRKGLERGAKKMPLKIIRGDIVRMSVDAIVNPATRRSRR